MNLELRHHIRGIHMTVFDIPRLQSASAHTEPELTIEFVCVIYERRC